MTEEIVRGLLGLALAVISVGGAIATIYIKKRWAALDFSKIVAIVAQVVKAAEMVGAAYGWSSEQKKTQALTWSSERTGLSVEELSTYVEAAVAQMKTAGEELMKKKDEVVPKP